MAHRDVLALRAQVCWRWRPPSRQKLARYSCVLQPPQLCRACWAGRKQRQHLSVASLHDSRFCRRLQSGGVRTLRSGPTQRSSAWASATPQSPFPASCRRPWRRLPRASARSRATPGGCPIGSVVFCDHQAGPCNGPSKARPLRATGQADKHLFVARAGKLHHCIGGKENPLILQVWLVAGREDLREANMGALYGATSINLCSLCHPEERKNGSKAGREGLREATTSACTATSSACSLTK